MDDIPPTVGAEAFKCPHCNKHSSQQWRDLQYTWRNNTQTDEKFKVGTCVKCVGISIWNGDRMIYPAVSNAPMANPDMPEEIKADYEEARSVESVSPRAACMLLRLCVEKIANDLVPGSGDLNEKIGKMVKNGLPEDVRKAMDYVRVFGGEAAHPLEVELRDDHETATMLFNIVNYISYREHTQKLLDRIVESMPDSKKAAIARRDAGARRGV